METLGIASVAAITVICYLIGMVAKLWPAFNDQGIPAVCGLTGAVLGLLWFYLGAPDFPAADPFTAAAVGIVSGFAATGVHQVYKQTNKGE